MQKCRFATAAGIVGWRFVPETFRYFSQNDPPRQTKLCREFSAHQAGHVHNRRSSERHWADPAMAAKTDISIRKVKTLEYDQIILTGVEWRILCDILALIGHFH
jgi:hypothetical protein